MSDRYAIQFGEREMATAVAVVAGALVFVTAFFFDVASLKRSSRIKPLLAFLVIALHGYALYIALWGTPRFWVPGTISVLGWVFFAIFAFLLFYSLAIELPSVKTYHQPGSSGHLVTTGTYALTRHPGVIWYILAMFSLLLATRATVLLVAVPVWSALNIILATVEDRYLFVRMFPEYRQYQKQTPMFIPTWQSFRNCLKTLRGE